MGGLGGVLAIGDASLGGSGINVLAGVLAGIAILLVFAGIQRMTTTRAASVRDRLDALVGPAAEARAPTDTSRRQRRSRRARRVYPGATNAAQANTFSTRLARELAQADLKLTVGEFMLISVVLASVGALLGFALPLPGHFILAVVLLVAGICGPRIYLARRRNQRQRAFNGQLADMLQMMAGALRSGYSLMQAMELAAREGPAPAGPEFERVVREIGLGLSAEEALNNLLERMQSEDMVLLTTAINVQREVGGNLVEVLETIAYTIRERVKLIAEMRVLTSQQQYSGYIIALLPVALSILLAVINPSYMLGVFQTTVWCGWTMLGCSVAMISAGYLVIRRIVNIKV